MAPYTFVGKKVPRIDGVAKVTGGTLFTADIRMPRMLYAKLLRSPYAHALIQRIDTRRAVEHPGVVRVITAKDLEGTYQDTSNRGYCALAQTEVVFHGQPVAAILAEDLTSAEEAMDLVDVEYRELPMVLDSVVAAQADAPLARSPIGEVDRSEEQAHATVASPFGASQIQPETNVSQRFNFTRGDVDAGFQEADVVVENTWHAPWVYQGYMEPHAAVVDYSVTGEYTVWTSTQGQFRVREELAKILKIPETKIKVEVVEMGGGFGAKTQPLATAIAAVLARLVRRPVKLVFSRSEDLRAANPVPQAVVELKTGAKKDGTLTALKARVIFDAGGFPGSPVMIGCTLMGGYYKCPNLDIEGIEVMTNRVSQGALRAPGVPQTTFAIESQIDIMARELGLDPLEMRMKNAVETGDPMPNGRIYPKIALRECLARFAETPFWKNREGKGPNQGVGIALGGWLGGLQPASAAVALNHDGTVRVLVGASDITGVNTSFQQIAGEVLRLPLERIDVRTGNTSLAPYAGVSAGSKTLRTVGHAVEVAARDVLDQMFQLTAERLECSPNDLEAVDGLVRVKGSPEKALTFELIATMTSGFGATGRPIIGKGQVGSPTQAPTFVVNGVKVQVDPETGEVTILDSIIVQDVGFAINPLSVEGQMQGGVSQALGIGYSEEMMWSESGALLNPGFLDYRMPTALDLPKLQTVLVEESTDEGPFGAKGVGEPPITAGSAALANAVYDAVGARVTTLPATPERVIKALGRLS